MPKTNGEFKIEKGKPLPRRRNHASKYPWEKMKVGDSFAVTGRDGNSVRASASLAGIRMRMKFSVSYEGEGYRVWRVK